MAAFRRDLDHVRAVEEDDSVADAGLIQRFFRDGGQKILCCAVAEAE